MARCAISGPRVPCAPSGDPVSDPLMCPVNYNRIALIVLQAQPIRVLVTGAAGQIAYSLLFSIAKGDVFGKDQVTIRGFACLVKRTVPYLNSEYLNTSI